MPIRQYNGYDGVAGQQVPVANAPQPSGITQVPQGGADMRMQWIQNRAAELRQERAAMPQQQITMQPNVTPEEYQRLGGFDRYTENNRGTIQTPEGQPATRDLNPLENLIARAGNQWADVASGYSGFNMDKGFTPQNIGAFIWGLPGQLASGWLQAPANLGAALTGNQYLDNPYTEELEVDADKNIITTEKYDTAQRVAQGLNFVMNTGLTGATGQLLRSVSPAFRTVGMMGKTLMRNASKPAQTAFTMGIGTAQEAGEEFVQSYLDDITYGNITGDSFERAVEASKWGALGGAAFSAGAQGVHALKNKIKGTPATNAGNPSDNSSNGALRPEIHDDSNEYQVFQDNAGAWEYMPFLTQWMKENKINKAHENTPGSVILKHAKTDVNMDLDDIAMSAEDIRDTYDRTTVQGQATIIKAFNTTKEEFDNALYNHVFNNQVFDNSADALTALLDARTEGRGARVALMRNPDTRNGGFYVNLKKITHGGDLQVHPSVYTIYGADVDGDTSILYFDPDIANVGGYASEMLAHPEGRQNISDLYLGYRSDLTEDEVRGILGEVFGGFEDNEKTIDYHARQMIGAMNVQNNNGEGLGEGTMGKALNGIYQSVYSASRRSGVEEDSARMAARTAVNKTLKKISGDQVQIYRSTMAPHTSSVVKQEFMRIDHDANGEASDKKKNIKTLEDFSKAIKKIRYSGKAGDSTLPIDLWEAFGFLTYNLTAKGNIIFRQYGEAGFNAKSVNAYLETVGQASKSKIFSDKDVVGALIRSSFRMISEGISPAKAVEGIFNSYVITRTLAEWGADTGHKIQSGADVELFLETFVKHYNSAVEMYNDAQKVLDTQGFSVPFGVVKKNILKDSSDAAIGRQLNKVFENTPIRAIFDTSLLNDSVNENTTFSQFIEPLSKKGGVRSFIEVWGATQDKAVQSFLNRLVSSYKSDKAQVSQKMQDIITNINYGNDDFDLVQKWENGTFDESDLRRLQAAFDAICLVIDPEIAFDAGIRGPKILGTRIGRMLVGKDKGQRLNAAVGLSLNTEFRPLIKELQENGSEVEASIFQILDEKAQVNDIHKAIAVQIMQSDDHTSKLLDALTSLDISWETKLKDWKELGDVGGIIDDTDDLFFDCLMTETSDFDISGMALRVKKAETSTSNMRKLLYEEQRADISNLIQMSDSNPSVSLSDFIFDCAKNARTSYNIDILGAKLYAAATFVNAQMEKGTNENAGTISYQVLEAIVNGSMIPYINQITGERNGVSSMQSFASNRYMWLELLNDPSREFDLYDIATGEHGTISFDAIMKDVDSTWVAGSKMNDKQAKMLLTKYPQLSEVLSDSRPQAIYSGGNPSVVDAKSKKMTSMFERYVYGETGLYLEEDQSISIEMERRLEQISNYLLNWNDYTGYLVRAIGDKTELLSSPKQFNDEVIRVHNKFVRGVFKATIDAEDGMEIKKITNAYFSDIMTETINDLNSTFSAMTTNISNMFNDSQSLINSVAIMAESIVTKRAVDQVDKIMKQEDAKLSSNDAYIEGSLELKESNLVDMENLELFEDEIDRNRTIYEEKITEIYEKLYSLIYHVYSDKFDLTGTVSPNPKLLDKYEEILVKSVKSAFGFDESTADSYIKETSLYKDMYRKVQRAVNSVSNNLIPIDEFGRDTIFLEDEFTNITDEKVETFISKAIKMLNDVGEDENHNDVRKKFNNAFKEYRENNGSISGFVSLMNYYNSSVFIGLVNQARSLSGSNINVNIINDMNETIDSVRSLLTEIRAMPDFLNYDSINGFKNEMRGKDFDLPKMNFSSTRNQALVSSLKMVERGSIASTRVGVNGSATKMLSGFGFLSPYENGHARGRSDLTAGQLVALADRKLSQKKKLRESDSEDKIKESYRIHDWNKVKCTTVPEGQEVRNKDVMSIEVLRKKISKGKISEDAPIRYFNPDDNIHGIDDLNTEYREEWTIKKYSVLGSILGLIQDDAQEAMVLKAKKNFASKQKWIVDKRERNSAYSIVIPDTALGNPEEAYNNMRKKLLDARHDFAYELFKEFEANHSSASLDYSSALVLAQAMTPAFKLSFSNGQQVFFDVKHLFESPEEFVAAWENIVNGRQVVGVSLKFSTPEEISGKILRAVSKISDDDLMKVKYTNNVAAEEVFGWDGVDADSLSVQRVMANVNPSGYSFDNGILGENTATPQQLMLNSLFNSSYGTVPTRSYKYKKTSYMRESDRGKIRLGEKKNKIKTIGKEKTYTIVQAFIPESWGVSNGEDGETIYNETYRRYSPLISTVKGHDPSAVAIVLDQSVISKAEKWALDNNNKLMIPQDVFISQGYQFSEYKGAYVDKKGKMWYIVDPKASQRYNGHAAGVTSAPRTFLHKDNIFFTYVDKFIAGIPGMSVNGIFKLSDAEIIGWNRAGEITREIGKNVTVDASTYLGKGNGNYKILTKDEVLREFGNENSRGYKLIDDRSLQMNEARTNASIASYVELLKSLDENYDGVIKGGVGKGDVIGIISDGVQFAPIYLPNSATRTTTYTGLNLIGSTVQLYWTGSTKVGGEFNDRVKMAIDGEAFKGELSMASPNQVAPQVFANGQWHEVQMAVSNDTQSGRAVGKDKQFLIRDLWYASKHFGVDAGFSYLYERTTNAEGQSVIQLKKSIRDLAVKEYGEQNASLYLADFERGTGDMWERVRLGRIKFFDDSTEGGRVKNEAIQKVLLACKQYSIEPLDVFDFMNVHVGVDETVTDTTVHLVFQNLSRDEILQFYAGMDRRICADGIRDDLGTEDMATNDVNQPMFNRYGQMKTTITTNDTEGNPVNTIMYASVRVGPMNSIGDESSARTAGFDASYPYQHIYRRADDYGYLPREIKDMVNYAKYLTLDPTFIAESHKARLKEARKRAEREYGTTDDDTLMAKISQKYPHDSLAQIKHKREVNAIGKARLRDRTVIDGNEIVADPWDHDLVKNAMSKLRDGVEWSIFPHKHIIEYASKRQDGHSNLENGVNDVDVSSFAKSIEAIARNIKNKGIPIANDKTTGLTINDRYAFVRLTPEEIDIWWNYCKSIRDFHANNKQAFIDAVKEEANKTMKQVEQLGATSPAKARAILKEYEWDYNQWNDWDTGSSPYVYGGKYTFDQVYADNVLADALRQSGEFGSSFDTDEFLKACDRSREFQGDMKDLIKQTNRIKTVDIDVKGRHVTAYIRTVDDKTIVKILDNATQLSQLMALLNPGVIAGNMIDRVSHQGIMCGSMWLGRNLNVGPYATKRGLDQEIVRSASQDLVKVYCAMRMAALNGEELEFLQSLKTPEQIDAWFAERRKKMTPYQKAVERMYGLSTGGNKFIKTQIANFINRFAMFVDERGQEWWFEKTENGVSRLENWLAENPVGWFTYVFGATNDSPSLTEAMQAMNSAKTGDMAQRNVLSMMLANAVRGRSLPKFLVTTMVSRFPGYSLNIAGRMLNWVMPMSSINYVFTNMVAERAHQKAQKNDKYVDPHYEQVQIHRSLREAMLVDITHLGVTAVTGILVTLAGGIEPPEDERKWGNIDEWTVCGLRVGEAWWIEDILGMALPSAAFTKSMMMGKPRFDILFNGASQVMYNNPILKVADVVGFLADPEGHVMTDYAEDYERFKNARGGAPSFTDWMLATGTSLTLNWASQFILPSMVKEWYQSAQLYETSYKEIFEENVYGALTEEGAAGSKTMETTYQDAMLRRLTKRNPILGWLADMVIHPNTGYLAGEMPRTKYLDDAQLAQAEVWSIKDLEPEAAEAKLLEIVAVMQSYDDMNELRETGFYLDNVTKSALSSLCWDTINELDQWYNGLQADGYFDYYAMGNGNFEEGQEIVGEIKQYYKSMRNYWSDFYYKKVRSDVLNEPMVVYNRYNTTYAHDSEGNIYATGFRPTGPLPFIGAPGQIDNPEGTAGWGNDWATISAVTGKPMDQRALLPLAQGVEDWPSLEDWKDENSPNGYSSLYELWHGSNMIDTDGDGVPDTEVGKLTGLPTSGKKSGGKSTKSYGRSYGGGGGSRRSGGGGGYSSGNGYPTIRSNWSNPNMTAPYVMDRVNRRSAQFDYLRPAFETKGSREAYKREDI